MTEEKPLSVCPMEGHNYGIDALKLLSMLMVAVLHVLGQGGILSVLPSDTINGSVAWLLEIASYGAVNIFALVTGYLMYGRHFKTGRLLSLWTEVVFYALAVFLVFRLFLPEAAADFSVLWAFAPASYRLWWYFTAYFALFFFMPFLNRLLTVLTGRQTAVLSAFVFVLFSFLPTAFYNTNFGLSGGYSFLWIASLYIIGAAVRKYDFAHGLKKRYALSLYVGAVLLTWGSRTAIRHCARLLSLKNVNQNLLIDYLSPTIVLSSVALLLLFKELKLGEGLGRLCKALAPLSFAVYIIHAHPLIWENLMKERFIFLSEQNAFVMAGGVLLAAAGIFAVCVGIEFLRVLLFRVTRLSALLSRLGVCFDRWLRLEL